MDILQKGKFWRIFFIPVLFHGLWDWEFFVSIGGLLSYGVLIVVIWVVLIAFINMGLNEVKQLNRIENEKMSEMQL